jgi:hypothetical protein
VALAGDEHDVAAVRGRDRLADRRAAIELERPARAAGVANAANDRVGDRSRILSARVVAGDDHAIGKERRDTPHVRALSCVAIAAASEYADQLAAVDDGRAQRGQHLFERVGRVRVIDDDERRESPAEALHPAGRRGDVPERGERVVERDPAREQHAEDAEHVRRVERPGDLRADFAAAPRRVDRHADPGLRVADRGGDDVGVDEPVGQHLLPAAACGFGEALAERVVDVDHARVEPGPDEQARLCRPVRRHRSVVVQVIASQVGEQRDVELDAVDATLVERMRRDLHRDLRARPRRAFAPASHGRARHPASYASTSAERRRGRCPSVPMIPARRPHASRTLRDPVRARCLAVGAGDPGDPQRARRISVDEGGDRAELRLQVVDREVRDFPRRVPAKAETHPTARRRRRARSRPG